MDGNYFYSKTDYQSPSWIKNIQQKLPVSNNTFFTPGSSLQLQYINGTKGSWEPQINQHVMRGPGILSNKVNGFPFTSISLLQIQPATSTSYTINE